MSLKEENIVKISKSLSAYVADVLKEIDYCDASVKEVTRVEFSINNNGVQLSFDPFGKTSSWGNIQEFDVPYNDFIKNPQKNINLFMSKVVDSLNSGNVIGDKFSVSVVEMLRKQRNFPSTGNLALYGELSVMHNKLLKNKNIDVRYIDIQGMPEYTNLSNTLETAPLIGKPFVKGHTYFQSPVSEKERNEFIGNAFDTLVSIGEKREIRSSFNLEGVTKFLEEIAPFVKGETIEAVYESFVTAKDDFKNKQVYDTLRGIYSGELKSKKLLAIEKLSESVTVDNEDFFNAADVSNLTFLSVNQFNLSNIRYYDGYSSNVKLKYLDKSNANDVIIMATNFLLNSALKNDVCVKGISEFKTPDKKRLICLETKDGFDLTDFKKNLNIILLNLEQITEVSSIGSFTTYHKDPKAKEAASVFIKKAVLDKRMDSVISEEVSSYGNSFKL